jgi:hypothetical protein
MHLLLQTFSYPQARCPSSKVLQFCHICRQRVYYIGLALLDGGSRCVLTRGSAGSARTTDMLLVMGISSLESLNIPEPTLKILADKVGEAVPMLALDSRFPLDDMMTTHKARKANASRVFLRLSLPTPAGE